MAVITPLLVLDSKELWKPVTVEESLGICGWEWDGKDWCVDGQPYDQLDLLPSMLAQDFAHLRPTGYHRTVPGGGLHWQQFWTWWPYNPKKYAGYGEHEGDWEMVQIGTVDAAGEHPVLMTASQHDGGEKREYWRVGLADSLQPIVYVARDSHANYYEPTKNVTDVVDGKGEELLPDWLEFGGWALWPGQWGNSANSPGPLATRRAWKAPHAWHGQAR